MYPHPTANFNCRYSYTAESKSWNGTKRIQKVNIITDKHQEILV
jgi:hypothetical protein